MLKETVEKGHHKGLRYKTAFGNLCTIGGKHCDWRLPRQMLSYEVKDFPGLLQATSDWVSVYYG